MHPDHLAALARIRTEEMHAQARRSALLNRHKPAPPRATLLARLQRRLRPAPRPAVTEPDSRHA
jgi:hypothetical protein